MLKPFALFLLLLISCNQSDQKENEKEDRPSDTATQVIYEGDSDQEAIEWADRVMAAMGGQDSWESTKAIQWTFFGRRTLLWDKNSGQVRIELPADSSISILNIRDLSGKVRIGNTLLTKQDSLEKYLTRAHRIWVNDSYWLFMPFKLKDHGVTLTFLGDSLVDDQEYACLSLSFDSVGYTPENRYVIFIDQEEDLVSRWDYYVDQSADTPYLSTPWKNYQPYGTILLSGDRGKYQLTNITVMDSVPGQYFEHLNEFLL
jgi:hypothetical protein